MAIRYGCFFSYAHGRHDLMIRFKTALADALRCDLEPYFNDENALFVDQEQLGGGDDIDRKIARAQRVVCDAEPVGGKAVVAQ